jgi:hypothetical protein
MQALWLVFPYAILAAPVPSTRALAQLTYVERTAEQGNAGALRAAREGGALQIGERLRTGEGAMVRLDFDWMVTTVSASSALHFPDAHFLHGVLERGRLGLDAERREMLKLVTDEAEVRGRGRAVVRRQERETRVSALAGGFSVEAGGAVVSVPAGTGLLVLAGQPPAKAVSLPAPPDGLVPGADPVYVTGREPIRLRWRGQAAAYHVEVLAVGSDTVLLEREVSEPTVELAIPWPGAFRWRVASLDPRGLEGRTSRDGFFCVLD